MTENAANAFAELQELLSDMRAAPFMRVRDANITVAYVNGTQVLFSTPNPKDFIQRFHNVGQFYEQSELESLAGLFPAGGVYVDIGANIGNHALYAAKFLQASRVIPFEPNRPAIRVLFENICLNGLFDVFDTSYLGLGLSDDDAENYRMETPHAGNLGMTHMVEGGGDILLTTGDAVLASEPRIDLIKIDIEGMEMRALAGLTETLARTQPKILIEVDHQNRADFNKWLEHAGYKVLRSFQKMAANQNFLIVPI